MGLLIALLVFKCRILAFFQYDEASRSGNNLPLDGLLFTAPKRRGHVVPCRGSWGGTRVNQEAEGVGRDYRQEPLSWLPQEGMDEAE